MSYPRIIQKVYREPWLITAAAHGAIRHALESRLAGDVTEDVALPIEDDDRDPQQIAGVAVIPVYGILGRHLSSLETMCGGCSVDAIWGNLELAAEDSGIRSIVLDFDSPGGVVTGIPELASFIRDVNERKRCYAYTEACCCSAAYWLASQCEAMFATPSAEVGSIGVYSVYIDISKQLEKDGVTVNAISAGEYKLTGAPFKPMTDEERAMLQTQVDSVYAAFKADVVRGHSIADADMQGQVFSGSEANKYGLVDMVVRSIDEAVLLLRS